MTPPPFELDVTVDERVELPSGYQRADLEAVVKGVLAAENADGPWEISIVLTDDAALRVLHRDYLNDDSPTDIMTFPAESDNSCVGRGDFSSGGDIAISVDRAAEQAPEGDWDTIDEIRFLVAHGVLHLLGWDDTTIEQSEAMLDRQREILYGLDCGSGRFEELA